MDPAASAAAVSPTTSDPGFCRLIKCQKFEKTEILKKLIKIFEILKPTLFGVIL